MLNQKFSLNDVVVLKLVSGEEIIGRYKSKEDSVVILTKAFSVTVQVMPNGQQALGLAPCVMISDPLHQEFPFEKHGILLLMKPPMEHPIVQEYQQATSGIVQAKSGIIV